MANVTRADIDALQASIAELRSDAAAWSDSSHVIRSGMLVLTMQVGFGLLETGLVQPKNMINILMKNIADTCFAGLAFMIFGWAFAYGDSAGGFIGVSQFFLVNTDDMAGWFFQFTFAAAAATIVSGTVAERASYHGYCIFSFIMTGIIYPVVVHWGWSSDGWLVQMGFADFAGSGIVHALGGVSALVATIMLGPRRDRFRRLPDGSLRTMQLSLGDPGLALVGTLFLWFGWYGFNPGSTLGYSGGLDIVAAHVAVTTTLGAAAGIFAGLIMCAIRTPGTAVVDYLITGCLAGLVAVTACCNVISPLLAVLIGAVGAVLAILTADVLLYFGIDDPVGAVGVHMVSGSWSVIATGLFASPEPTGNYSPVGLLTPGGNGMLLGVNLLGLVCILAWGAVTTAITLYMINKFVLDFRVSEAQEMCGLDFSEHSMIKRTVLDELFKVSQNKDKGDIRRLIELLSGDSVVDMHAFNENQSDKWTEWHKVHMTFPGLFSDVVKLENEVLEELRRQSSSVSTSLDDLKVQKVDDEPTARPHVASMLHRTRTTSNLLSPPPQQQQEQEYPDI